MAFESLNESLHLTVETTDDEEVTFWLLVWLVLLGAVTTGLFPPFDLPLGLAGIEPTGLLMGGDCGCDL